MNPFNFKRLSLTFFALISLAISISCSKDDDEFSGKDLVVTVNGKAWGGNITQLDVGNAVTLNARNGLISTVQLLIPKSSFGSYDLSTIVPVGIQYMSSRGRTYNDIKSGTFTIARNNDSERSGTFSAVIASAINPNDVVVLTNGRFTYRP